jgi:hypothetical protein
MFCQDELELRNVSVEEFFDGWSSNAEANCLEQFKFLDLYLGDVEFVVSDFIDYSFHHKGDYVFVLGSDEHGHNARRVEV